MKIPQFLKKIYFRYFFRVKKGKCLFVPHPGFTKLDKASIINYKADNCLIFVRYLLEHELCLDKELVIVSTTQERAHKEQEWCREHYPKANIRIIHSEVSRPVKKEWASAEYIIRSEDSFPMRKKKGQKYICISYYPISLKNDCYGEQTAHLGYRAKLTSDVDMLVSSSLINSQMDSAAFEIPFYKFKPIGKVRSDVMQQKEDVNHVREYLQSLCEDYKFKKVILYTPTHRDYENASFDIKRSILGFDVDKKTFEKFLSDNQLLIVCKLHPHQNDAIVDTDLPKGVIRFMGHDEFGLIELMKASDMLMTDYTSTYVDYLLLDKPVLFNFYDIELYEKSRGLAFYPFERICAGEIFKDEKSFYKAVSEALSAPNKYADMRKEMVEYLNTYHTDVCRNTYKAIFDE